MNIREMLRRKEPEPRVKDVVEYLGPRNNVIGGVEGGSAIAVIYEILEQPRGETLYGLFPASDWFDKEKKEMIITFDQVLENIINGKLTLEYAPRSHFKPYVKK